MNRKTHDPAWLEAHGYDGLWNPEGPCGCGLDDFKPCSEGPYRQCVPATVGADDGMFYPVARWMFLSRDE